MKIKTQAAQAAQQIREILKKNFPTTKFSVKSENFAGGNAVTVSWIDSVAPKKVEALISHYQYGKFNSMEDIYEYNNSRDDIPQTKYLSCNRKISDEVYQREFEKYLNKNVGWREKITNLNENSNWLKENWGAWTASDWIYRQICEEDLFLKEPKKEVESFKVEGLELVDYSEKAIALFGNTKEIKEKLKEIGGRFNPFLTKDGEKMAGWIFAKSKENELKNLIA